MNNFESPEKFSGRAILGLDLDGVVADYIGGFRPYAADYLGVGTVDLPDPSDYNLVRAWGFENRDSYLEAHVSAVKDGLFKNLPLIEGAKEALECISESGAHIRVVSHRLFTGGLHGVVVRDTAEWLDDMGIRYMSLCFTGLKDSVGAHVYIEDSPSSIFELRKMGIPTIIFSQGYNLDIPGDRVENWGEATGLILGKLGLLSR